MSYSYPATCFTVWPLDRLGRHLSHLIELIADLKARGVAFASLTEQTDTTTTTTGELIFHISGELASFGRQLLRERTLAGGLAAACEGGKVGGRPVALTVTRKREATRRITKAT